MLSNSRNTVARPIQPIRSLNIGILGPLGRSLEHRRILSYQRLVWSDSEGKGLHERGKRPYMLSVGCTIHHKEPRPTTGPHHACACACAHEHEAVARHSRVRLKSLEAAPWVANKPHLSEGHVIEDGPGRGDRTWLSILPEDICVGDRL